MSRGLTVAEAAARAQEEPFSRYPVVGDSVDDVAGYLHVRDLLGRDGEGVPVAAVTVWSAGHGRLGILEPMGVDPAHRGRGHGRAICLAAAAALQELGASAAAVATPSDNEGAVAAYRSAGFVAGPPSRDLLRP